MSLPFPSPFHSALRRTTIVLAIMGVSACAVMTGQHSALSPIDNQNLQLSQGSEALMPQEGWWRAYRSDTLNTLVEQALRDSPNLQVFATRIKASENAADAVHKMSYPMGQVKVDWTGQELFNTTIDTSQSTSAALASRGMGIPKNLDDQFLSITNLSAAVQWDVDLWGRNRAQYRAAMGQARAQTLEYAAARQAIIANIVGLHAQIMAYQTRLRIVDEQITTQSTLKQRWLEREKAGLQATQNSLQVDVVLAQLTQLKQSIGAQNAVARAQLAVLLGTTPERLPNISPEPTWQTLHLPNEIPAQILGTRPDIAAAREYIQASTAQVEAVKTEFYPDINIGVSTALQLLNMQNVLDFRGQNAAVKPAITLPLFNTIQLNAKLRQQQAQLDNTIAQYNQTVIQAVSDATQQLAQYRQASAYLTQQERIMKNNQKLGDLAQQRYRAGLTPQMETLMLKTAVLREQDALVMGHAMRRAQEARLANSLGTDFNGLVNNTNTHSK